MKTKLVQQVLSPPAAHMVGDGFRVHNFFPGGYTLSSKRTSPFLLLDYNAEVEFPATDKPRGVGVHPHRGFETVTIAYHGKIAHHDSFGNHGVIGEGDVQWMTAASGLLHKEYHEKEFSRQGGLFQMVQLWVNLPAKDKMSAPKYQPITNDMLGRVLLPESGGVVEVIAGSYQGVNGPAFTFTPIELYNVKIEEGHEASFHFPASYNTGLLVITGDININRQETVPQDHFALFENEGEEITLYAEKTATVLIMGGEPINEPVVSYGPFVMNTKDEILQAYSDVNAGKFGRLED